MTVRDDQHQMIISFSLFGDFSRFLKGVEWNAAQASVLYPGWVMRVYHNADPGTPVLDKLIQLAGRYPVLELSDVRRNSMFPNAAAVDRRLWRFLALGDPRVDVFLSRDLDSKLSKREAAAVQEWLSTEHDMHVMRDHPEHWIEIPAGMWGARLSKHRDTWTAAIDRMVAEKQTGERDVDQRMLLEYVWPLAFRSGWLLQHDSYLCHKRRFQAGLILPYPTQRLNESSNFVGAVWDPSSAQLTKACPPKCRKKLEWTTC